MQRPLKLLITAAMGAASLTGVVACGSSSGSSGSTTTPTTANTATSSTAESGPEGASTTAAAPSTSAGTASKVTMIEGKPNEFSMTMNRMAVPAGKVTFVVRNRGKLTHEMVVIRTNTKAASLPKDSSGKASESGSIGETGDIAAGATKTVTFAMKKGHYALICNLPGHYAGGMRMDFTVT